MDDPDLKQVLPNPNKPEGQSEQPAEMASDEADTFMPPTPGQVITSEPAPSGPTPSGPVPSGSIQPPGAEVPTSPVAAPQPGGGKKRGMKLLVWLIILALLAAGGWFAYQKYLKKSPTTSTSQNKDVQQINVGLVGADYGKLYPDMSLSSYSYLTNAQMFEGLVRYENKSKIVPDLATNWTNPDSKTWVFTVRSGVKFHDGHTLTAKDVKYSLDTIKGSGSDFGNTFTDTIQSVVVVNDNQVKITTTDPDPTLLNKLTFLYVIDANLPKGDEPSLAGTGPYKIKSGTTPSSTDVQMVASNDYHGGQVTTKAVNFGSTDTADALIKAYKAGKYDIIGAVPIDQASQVSGATRFVSVEPEVDFLGLNSVQPGPLQNKLVREAIAYAVDPVALGKAVGNDITPLNQLIPPSIPGYNPAIPSYKHDVNKAQQLLIQAGYPKGITLQFASSSEQALATELAKELKEANITLTLKNYDNFDNFINDFTAGKNQMYYLVYTSDILDGLDIYNSTLVGTQNYKNPKLDAVLKQANDTVDPAKRLKLLQSAAVIINQDVAAVPLYSANNLWLMNKDYAVKQDMPSSFLSVYFYKVHLK